MCVSTCEALAEEAALGVLMDSAESVATPTSIVDDAASSAASDQHVSPTTYEPAMVTGCDQHIPTTASSSAGSGDADAGIALGIQPKPHTH